MIKPVQSTKIRDEAKERFLLVNIADTPELCDFYLGGIVLQGKSDNNRTFQLNGKIANMQAKRLSGNFWKKCYLMKSMTCWKNLHAYRGHGYNGDFEYKVKAMNEVTEVWVQKQILKIERLK